MCTPSVFLFERTCTSQLNSELTPHFPQKQCLLDFYFPPGPDTEVCLCVQWATIKAESTRHTNLLMSHETVRISMTEGDRGRVATQLWNSITGFPELNFSIWKTYDCSSADHYFSSTKLRRGWQHAPVGMRTCTQTHCTINCPVSLKAYDSRYVLFPLSRVHEPQCVSDHPHFHLFIYWTRYIFKHTRWHLQHMASNISIYVCPR